MFWGLLLKPNKKYTQKVKKSFHLSQVSLDLTSCDDQAQVQLYVTTTDLKILLATLSKATSHVAVDLVFSESESISFHTQGGNGSVHLAGYFLDDEDDFGDFDGLGDEVDSEEEAPQLVDASATKAGKKGKKSQEVAQEEEEDSSEDDTFELGGEEEGGSEEEEDDDVEGEEEQDDDDDDDEEDDSEEEEEVQEPKPKQLKLEKPKQNGVENGQKATKQEKKQQQQQQNQQAKKGGERTLSGNVKVEDIVVGKGDEAKSGKKVQVYYEGRLKTNNKVFDSSKQGNGFKFKLGQGEVIKGWDVGVAGMKVGGKRRITCPPHMAYGARGSPPVIPPNSTLVFEVELKRVL